MGGASENGAAEKESKGAKKKPGIHAGHRQRMKNQFLRTGGRYMEDHQLLEMALFYSVPQRDTNPLAHQLLDRFGSLSGVIHAAPEALLSMKGVSVNTVALLKLIAQLIARHQESLLDPDRVLDTPELLAEHLQSLFLYGRDRMIVLFLDARGRVLSWDALSVGSSAPRPDPKELVSAASRNRATEVALGIPRPGQEEQLRQEDLSEVLRCERALATIGIRVRDVLFFCGEEWISLRQLRLLH